VKCDASELARKVRENLITLQVESEFAHGVSVEPESIHSPANTHRHTDERHQEVCHAQIHQEVVSHTAKQNKAKSLLMLGLFRGTIIIISTCSLEHVRPT
jgi:hypothetical protein